MSRIPLSVKNRLREQFGATQMDSRFGLPNAALRDRRLAIVIEEAQNPTITGRG
jgi:hypothetical protein